MSSTPFQGVVTPEAVVLSFDEAGVGSRSAAAAIDLIIRIIAFSLFSISLGILDSVTTNMPAWALVTALTLWLFLLTGGYSVVFETLWRGKTPGKAVFGLRVVTVEGAPVRFRHTAIRGALGMIEILSTFGLLAATVIFFSKRNQRLGDMVAGTLVLRERRGESAPVATVFMPYPGTEEFTATLDVSLLVPDEYLTIRSFLTRAHSLRPQARQMLSEQLARQFVGRLAVQPPGWMPAEVFLVSVASAYQRRFAGADTPTY